MFQSSSKKVITKEEWEKKLSEVKIRKEDMNKLVMNFLVTEGYVEAAEKFQLESGTQRILCNVNLTMLLILTLCIYKVKLADAVLVLFSTMHIVYRHNLESRKYPTANIAVLSSYCDLVFSQFYYQVKGLMIFWLECL